MDLVGHNGHTLPTNIPLHCNVCPKKPDFSDVSHLLTHIASKGHLSHYFRIKVKAGSDVEAHNLIEQYDNWYHDWNVDDLMRERMSQKERRKGSEHTGRAATVSRRFSAMNSSASTSRNTSILPQRARRLRASTLDSRLGPRIKIEPDSRSTTPILGSTFDSASFNRAYAPPMQTWPGGPYADSLATGDNSVMDSAYSTPSDSSGNYEVPRRGAQRSSKRNMKALAEALEMEEDDLEFDDSTAENTRLKGVFWDGMGMFDSATPEMRRQRNQKKARSVIQLLQATSEVVEATELVFDAEGELQRERPITGNPDEDADESPLPGETTPEASSPPKRTKKPKKRARPALAPKDVNTGRVLRRRRDEPHYPSRSAGRRTTRTAASYEDDDDLTYAPSRSKKRTGLAIPRDSPLPAYSFSRPAPLDMLTAAHINTHQAGVDRSLTRLQNGSMDRGHLALPSMGCTGAFRPDNLGCYGLASSNIGYWGNFTGQPLWQNTMLPQNVLSPHDGLVTTHQQSFAIGQQQMGSCGVTAFPTMGQPQAHGQETFEPLGMFVDNDHPSLQADVNAFHAAA